MIQSISDRPFQPFPAFRFTVRFMQDNEYSVTGTAASERAQWLDDVEAALSQAERAAIELATDQAWMAPATSLMSRIEEVRAAIAPLKAVALAALDPEWIELSHWFRS